MILGGGIVGTNAAKMAAGLGADVTILDNNLNRLRYLDDILPANVSTFMSSEYNIRSLISTHDLVVGAVLIPGAKAPKLITRDMLKEMRPGTVLVDVAVDQGGCIETCHPTTHEDPTFLVDDVLHYCVANMPGAGALHLHAGPHQRHPALRHAAGQPGLGEGLRPIYPPHTGTQHRSGVTWSTKAWPRPLVCLTWTCRST